MSGVYDLSSMEGRYIEFWRSKNLSSTTVKFVWRNLYCFHITLSNIELHIEFYVVNEQTWLVYHEDLDCKLQW